MMDESTLVASLRRDIDSSTGKSYDELNASRAKALKYYLGENYGNEQKGRSRIVTTEVADTIESMLPQLLRPFTSSDRAVYFDPVGPEDSEGAKQETDYVNHVFYKENAGFDVLYTWFKDALLSKNGIVKYYWEEREEIVTESYTGLTEQELFALLSEDNVEVVEQTRNEEWVMNQGMETNMVTYDVKLSITRTIGQTRVENIPPEEFLVNVGWSKQSLQAVPFCAHDLGEITLSDLRSRGYDTSKIEQYAGAGDDEHNTLEEYERFRDISSSHSQTDDTGSSDPSMQTVNLTECYKRVDFDGDGYAELRKILLVNGHHVIENEEIDYVPFESITPVPMTHRFIGRSAADQAMDLQLQKSTLVRNIMDNLYLMNNVRHAAVEGEVNIGDLLDSTPGGVVRMNAPGMVSPLAVQPFTGHAFGMLEYLDSIKESRTGATRYNQGMDADSLNKTAHGIEKIMDASAQRLELIARLFGEGVKRLMLGIHRLLLQNQDKEKVIQLRGQWVPVNPAEWRERTNMTVVVGLGTENRDKMLQSLMMVLQLQKEAVGAGIPMAGPAQLYNTAIQIVENSGLKSPELYFTDPSTVPPTPPEPSAEEKMVEAQRQIAEREAQIKELKVKLDFEIENRKVAVTESRLQLDAAIAEEEVRNDTLDRVVDAARGETDARGTEDE